MPVPTTSDDSAAAAAAFLLEETKTEEKARVLFDTVEAISQCLHQDDIIAQAVTVPTIVNLRKEALALQTESIAILHDITPHTPDFINTMTVMLSDIFHMLLSVEVHLNHQANKDDDENKEDSDEEWVAPSEFNRKTTKYFVAEENLAEVVLKSVSELPILVYGRTGNLTGMEEEVASPITSVYFDNAEMEMYEERIARLEGAKLFRVRWYGPKPTGTQLFFCELKTHHNEESGQDSNKKRVEVQACDLEQLIDVQNHPWTDQEAKDVILRATPKKKKKLKAAIKLLTQIQHLIVEMQLRPCVTTAYKRLSLQSSHTNDLRMTIDREVTMIDEYANALKPSSCKKSWCLAGEKLENIPAEAAVKIPYTIFEVKLMEGAAKPEHIQTFEDRDIMIVNGKFSKFITGAALHHMEDVNVAPVWATDEKFAPLFQTNEEDNDATATSITTTKRSSMQSILEDFQEDVQDALADATTEEEKVQIKKRASSILELDLAAGRFRRSSMNKQGRRRSSLFQPAAVPIE
mmetsp:Transcript_55027/g.61482  ORF Transcript_55027/g.61482 Transcript_55027/m.61482 type:complete len:520 (-) Transcript_55027:138-1697(-)|eukprot:CAMPEP_0170770858 /NCGR_PEP_ID=MMETSP0733-20121128/7732_1 /TAXON_ID=186038 /ORGANISM="Fragilariopsis kerguelensis, Strain L26-C5" /LENGTH=519 /DNA_ID=CAMNT_0011112543 /DNA_START=68 /DNA_END=1627 /DNA_ORIENTATION=-